MRSGWRFPILCTLAAVLFIALVDWVLIPIHERGELQQAIGWLDGASRVLQTPGLEVAQCFGLRMMHHTGPAAWAVMMAVNVPVYLALSTLVRWMWWPAGRGATARGLPLAASQTVHREPAGAGATISGDSGSTVCEAASGKNDAGTALAAGTAGTARTANESTPGVEMETGGAAIPSRRQFLAAGNRLALGGAAAVFGYAFAAEPHHFVVTRRSIPIRGLPASLDGLTIAQLTDIHHGPWTPLSYVRRIVAATNALGADLVALTGDYVLYSPAYIRPVVGELAELRPRIGVVGTMGNHDWWEDGWKTMAEFRRVGIPLIDNDRLTLSPDRRLTRDSALSEGLCVAGIGDLWEGSPDFEKALAGVSPRLPRLLLSHNPDAAESQAVREGQYRVDLMLSGHTHGGQIWVPGLGTPMIPSKYGQRYARGLIQGPAFPVFVSCGLGTTSIPLRFCRPPEIVVLRLERAEA